MSINVELYVWDYNSQTQSTMLGDTLLTLEESLERVNFLMMAFPAVNRTIEDLTDDSFAISYEYVVTLPRMFRYAKTPPYRFKYGLLYKFDRHRDEDDMRRLRHMVRTYAVAYPDLTSDKVKAYLANPLSLV